MKDQATKDIPSKYDYSSWEEQAINIWKEQDVYSFDSIKKRSSKPVYTIDTPPPTVSGSLHIGHIFSYLQTDFIARYKRMDGHAVFYPMGFDDNGLPTERFVEDVLGAKSSDLSRADFLNQCELACSKAREQFADLWKKIGLSVDWNKTYSTISQSTQEISQKSFVQLLQKNLVYRKMDPALFCTYYRTTISQADLESVEKRTLFSTIKFQTTCGQDIEIATTRPELLPACVAIFYHPDDSRFRKFESKKAVVPIFGQQVEFIADEKVDPEKGSGLVMCCTFGDSTDVTWYKNYNLKLINVIGRDGKMTGPSGILKGLYVKDARKKILEVLQDQNLILDQKEIVHTVNVYERSKKEVEYIVVPQWFIKTLDYKSKFLEQADKIVWKPKHMKYRYIDWVQNLSWDWCVSRQRNYGIPIPVWYCKNCGEVVLPSISDLPLDPLVSKPSNLAPCRKCDKMEIEPETDVLDTWATSALTPYINKKIFGLQDDEFLPMDLRPQAHDIIRTWAFDTIVASFYHSQEIPWKKILISGHVLADTKNKKISKSDSGKKLSPQNLIKDHSADAIRIWAAKGKLGVDTVISFEQIDAAKKLVNKIWNAFKFCKLQFGDVNRAFVPERLDVLSKWIIDKNTQVKKEYHKHFENDDYTSAFEVIERFFYKDFCDNYIEIVKDQIFNPEKYEKGIEQVYKFSMFVVGLDMLKMFAPFAPFICERVYQMAIKMEGVSLSLHSKSYGANHGEDHPYMMATFEQEAGYVDIFIQILGLVRKLKSEEKISLKTPIKKLTIFATQEIHEALRATETLLCGVTKSEELIIKDHDQTQTNRLEKVDDVFYDGFLKVKLEGL